MMILLFFTGLILLFKAEKPLPFNIFFLPPNQKKSITVYENGNFDPQFDPSSFPPLSSCTPQASFEIDKSG
jgi:hypothetical protein